VTTPSICFGADGGVVGDPAKDGGANDMQARYNEVTPNSNVFQAEA